MPNKLMEDEFYQLKRQLMFRPAKMIARKFDRSVKTVLQVKGSKTYQEYKAQNIAQHPETRYSARDHLLTVHRKHFMRSNGMWIEPRNMEQAINEINAKLNKLGGI